jgi:3-oxoacyl-[acyl-carrier protein] reductase
MSSRLDLSGRVGVVTGASRGIGAAIAETLAGQGMNLVLCSSSDGTRLDECSARIVQNCGVLVDCLRGDVADPAISFELAKLAFSKHRRLDVWVNNAGVLVDGLIGMVPPKDIDQTLGTNLAGVIHGTQAAVRVMSRGQSGSIINMTSIIGRFGNVGQLVYGASKAGVIGATLSAAKELAPKGIRVNAIAPGFIRTDMVAALPPEKFTERVASIRMGRIGEPEDIADTVLFLASDLSRYVTGQVIGVDGGMAI